MGLSPPIMNDIKLLDKKTSYNLSSGIDVTRRNIKRSELSFETVSTTGSILWGKLPITINETNNLHLKIQQP